MTTDPLIHLLTWLSPAFPTGGFAYSHGLEWAIECRTITTQATLQTFLTDLHHHGTPRTDAILLRHAFHTENLAHLATFAAATAPTAELCAETLHQGTAFITAAKPWLPTTLAATLAAIGPIAYPIAVGALAAATHLDEDATTLAYLHAITASLISAAIRLIPLGQNAGLALQAALEPTIHQTAIQSRNLPLSSIYSACIAADIASMRHETQPTRLFRS